MTLTIAADVRSEDSENPGGAASVGATAPVSTYFFVSSTRHLVEHSSRNEDATNPESADQEWTGRDRADGYDGRIPILHKTTRKINDLPSATYGHADTPFGTVDKPTAKKHRTSPPLADDPSQDFNEHKFQGNLALLASAANDREALAIVVAVTAVR